MVAHDGTILLCGGRVNEKKCLQMDHGTWKEHSTLNAKRAWHSAVTTQTATFIFGGWDSRTTYEYLPKGSTKWIMGKTEIPGGFEDGSAIAVYSEQQIWLIGGVHNSKRILTFNVKNHTFHELPTQLNLGRIRHRCAFIPNTNKILITGGCDEKYSPENSSEIIDTEDGLISMSLECQMKLKRYGHGIGVLTICGEDRLAVFGGKHDWDNWLSCVELYNANTEKWEIAPIHLNAQKEVFGFLTVKLSNVICNLKKVQSKKKRGKKSTKLQENPHQNN